VSAAARPDAAVDPLIGRVLAGRYRVEAPLGQGSMGAVYRAVQVTLRKNVALKVLAGGSDAESLERFTQEARVAATLKHQGIAEVYDFGVTDEGQPFYVMELLQGTDLAHRIAACGPLPPAEAVGIARAIASALAVAHAAGVVHRDLKPANIFLVPQASGGEVVKVVDFGISKVLWSGDEPRAQLTMPGLVCGTPHYMSPEQAGGGPVDARSDIYALGVVLYEMLCGNPPFDAPEVVKILNAHLSDPPPPLAAQCPGLAVPRALELLVMRALAKAREDRFASMSELEAALAAWLHADPAAAATGLERALPAKASVRRLRWLLPLAAVGCVAAGVLAWLLVGRPAPRPVAPPPIGPVVAAAPAAVPVAPPSAPASAPAAPAAPPARPAVAFPRAASRDARVRPAAPARSAPAVPARAEPIAPAPAARSYRLDDLKPYGQERRPHAK
jgi:serine/threonine-protein kinase